MTRRTASLIMAAFVLSIAALVTPFGEGMAEPVVLPDTAVRP